MGIISHPVFTLAKGRGSEEIGTGQQAMKFFPFGFNPSGIAEEYITGTRHGIGKLRTKHHRVCLSYHRAGGSGGFSAQQLA